MCKIVGYVNRRTLLNEHRVIVCRSYMESGKSNRRMAGSNGRKYLTNRDKHRCTETSRFARDDQAFLSVTTISVREQARSTAACHRSMITSDCPNSMIFKYLKSTLSI